MMAFNYPPPPEWPGWRPTPIQAPAAQFGWECPRCHATYAPWMAKCTECKPKTLGERMQAAQPPSSRIGSSLPLVESASTSAVA